MAKYGSVKDKSWGTLGGKNPMHSFRGAGEQEPDSSSQEVKGNAGRREQKIAAGGTGIASSDNSKHGSMTKHGSNRYGAGPQASGTSSPTLAKQEGFAHGGKTAMFGNRGSKRSDPGMSSPP